MKYPDIIRAAQIAERHYPDGHVGGADHDVICLCPIGAPFTEEEREELVMLGFSPDDDRYCWCGHV